MARLVKDSARPKAALQLKSRNAAVRQTKRVGQKAPLELKRHRAIRVHLQINDPRAT
jgi:hypothetical protein